MQELFNKMRDFNEDAYRNIVSLRESENLFDDLTDDEEAMEIAIAAEMRVKQNIPQGKINRGFYYHAAINYPFETEPYMASRYSDGSFPVWYGSLELATTIYETAHQMMRTELAIEGVEGVIIRQREVYKAHCQSLLVDLTKKQHEYQQLIADNYDYTQFIGKRLVGEGHPGLLAPSARHLTGTNVVIFNQHVLSNPRVFCYLTYSLDIKHRILRIERELGKKSLVIDFSRNCMTNLYKKN